MDNKIENKKSDASSSDVFFVSFQAFQKKLEETSDPSDLFYELKDDSKGFGKGRPRRLYLFTDKSLDPGFDIPLINPGNSFDVNENSCYSKLGACLSEDIFVRTIYFSKTGKSIYNWCTLADGARGYCFCYRFKDIKRAIKEKLSTRKGKFICVYGKVNYGNHSSKDASNPWKDYVNSVFLKSVFYMTMEGFDLLILGSKDCEPCDLETISVKPVSCSIAVNGHFVKTHSINTMLGLSDLKKRLDDESQ